MKTTIALLGAAGLALLGGTAPASADVILDTTVYPPALVTQMSPGVTLGQGFLTGAAGGTLTSVVLSLSDSTDSGGFFVDLYSDAAGQPGTVLATLSGSSQPTTAGLYAYTGSAALAANTGYFVAFGFSPTGTGSIGVQVEDTDTDGTFNIITSDDGGATWLSPINGLALTLQVNADPTRLSPVPEPSAWAGLSAALLGVVWVAKRRFAPAN